MNTIARAAFRLWSWLRRSQRAPQPRRQATPRCFVSVDITPRQRDLLRPCWREIERQPHRSGRPGTVIAQMHRDYMTVFVLDHAQASALREILVNTHA